MEEEHTKIKILIQVKKQSFQIKWIKLKNNKPKQSLVCSIHVGMSLCLEAEIEE